MANLHVQSHWKSDQDSWDEGWYYAGQDTLEAHAQFLKTNSTIPADMALWRGRGTELLGFTVTEEGGLRRAQQVPRRVRATRGSSSLTNADFRRDAPNTSCKYSISFVGGGSRIYDIRGIADIDIITPVGEDSRLSSYASDKVDAMLDYLKVGLGAAGRRLLDIGQEPWKIVESFRAHPTNPNWTQFTASAGSAIPDIGDVVYLRNFNRATELWLKGYWRVVSRDEPTRKFSIPATYLSQLAEMTPRNLQYRQAIPDYPAWSVIGFKYVSSRKTRGPFDKRHGAQSGVKLRRLTPAV